MAEGRNSGILSDLNPSQRPAVVRDGSPQPVLEGPGTGKTRTLVHRAARLKADGADPARILLLTFTRNAEA
ncbi:MAG: UvrD-helicase domain-containing protein [Deltaproteobacteria bacterium]|nr:UvrD-helicase domain-containing protein [Deltaproteobacteria bacterium]